MVGSNKIEVYKLELWDGYGECRISVYFVCKNEKGGLSCVVVEGLGFIFYGVNEGWRFIAFFFV